MSEPRATYSVDEPGLAVVLNYGLQLEDEPQHPCGFDEAVALSVRPGTLGLDESGEIGDEQVMEIRLTRRQLRAMLHNADAMWLDTCAANNIHPRNGANLSRLNPWRTWAAARRYLLRRRTWEHLIAPNTEAKPTREAGSA